MKSIFEFLTKDFILTFSILFLLVLSFIVLKSIAPNLFPVYFIYFLIAIAAFWFFSQISFEIISLFSTHLYVFSIILLVLTFIIGRVTRGAIRWIPIGPISIQSAELVRPFLLVFFANFLGSGKINFKKFIQALTLLAVPVFLILIQPSLGVSILTLVGFAGILIASRFDKKYIIFGILFLILTAPVFYKIMAPYQRERLSAFLSPDKLGSGYNSLQSVIALGSGKFTGMGLGHGTQTQLSFLPEKQTDFIFAATGEELGFIGATLMLLATFFILYRLTTYMEHPVSSSSRAFISGFFLIYLTQVLIHVGMNMGILPVTGLPFPLVSAGGSSLLATLIGLGIAVSAVKR